MRRPLIVISPKSLLEESSMRVPLLKSITDGSFQYVIDDPIKNSDAVKKIILCSGKIYYDLFC